MEIYKNSEEENSEKKMENSDNLENENSKEEMENEMVIGKYKIIEELGRGSYGTVYLAIYNKFYFAIKKIDKNKSALREKKILQKLCDNDYFPVIYEFLVSEKYFYIVQEYLENYENLKFTDIKKNIKNFIIIVQKLIKGLRILHNLGIAHCDITPNNIMINYDTLDIKYIDFGSACNNNSKITSCEIDSIHFGTIAYQSPELFGFVTNEQHEILSRKEDKNFYSARQLDIWSLGCVIYEMIIGYDPSFKYKNIEEYAEKYFYEIDVNKNQIDEYIKICKIFFEKNRNIFHIKEFNLNLDLMLSRTEERLI